jgi:hypothetical protein
MACAAWWTLSIKDESILTLLGTQAAIAIEKMQLFEKVKKLAITDGLTGLYNHRYFVDLGFQKKGNLFKMI